LNMPDVSIDSLNLHLSGFSEEDGRQLARLIAEGLSKAPLPSATGGQPAMQVKVTAPPASPLERVSEMVLADLVRQLKRSL
jgi:hypothetical protein